MTSFLASAAMAQASRGGRSTEEKLAATGAAVNLRDIAEAAPGKLKKGVIFRCSQIYSQQVLKELHIRTIVDLRGRAPTHSSKDRHHRHHKSEAAAATPAGPGSQAGASNGNGNGNGVEQQRLNDAAATAGRMPGSLHPDTEVPPSLLEPDMVDQLQQQGSQELQPGGDLVTITRPRSRGGSRNGSGSGSDEEEEAGTSATADKTDTLPTSDQEGTVEAIRQNFNLIPGREFGLRLLRFPPRVWLSAAGKLVTGKDARKPFIDAFADEQILGFTKYYILILEHSKRNIADVLRIFTAREALPALVHCAHGKDRTGVVVMLLMLLCGLDPEEVTADYEQSETQLRKYRESLGLPEAVAMAVIPLDDVITASTRETIRAVMTYLLERYLTVEDYLLTTGLTHQELAAIRRNLMVEQPERAPTA